MSSRDLYAMVQRCRVGRVTSPTEGARGVSLAEAYTIQRDLWGDRPLSGYKLSLISRAKQRQMGIDSPIYWPVK